MFSLFLLFLATLAAAYPDPWTCTGDCFAHDLTIIQRQTDKKYFQFSTGGGISVFSSETLKGPWKSEGHALPHGSSIHLDNVDSGNIWV